MTGRFPLPATRWQRRHGMAGAGKPWSVQLLAGQQHPLAAVDQVADALGFAAGQLDRSDFQGAGAAGDFNAFSLATDHGAWQLVTALIQCGGLMKADAL